ncbi:MAG TPA: hypothetical protein VG345_09570 [Bryobacteraceae bacterium]|nr:hypothetical protein [Bryobacteraceae bacterium]
MTTSAAGTSESSYLYQAISNALSSEGLSANTSTAATSTSNAAPSDTSSLSPFAQLVSAFQQLQQSDPTTYAKLTQQIGTNLQSESQTAQSQGNSSVAGELSQLANDFTTASQTGQLPNLQDLAQAVGGGSTASGTHGHHHHHHSDASSSSDSSSASDSTASSSTASFSSNTSTSSILLQTLSSAGIGVSSGTSSTA